MSDILNAPCLFCGYNGSGYWKTGTHEKDCPFHKVGGIEERRAALPKVIKSLRTQIAEAKAEIERLRWQPIETAPDSRLIIAWMEGHETHHGSNWYRSGPALIAMHDGVISEASLRRAKSRIIGMHDEFIDGWFLRPTHWMPLPEPPADTGERQ